MKRIIPFSSIELRKKWLQKLGGLSSVSVKNKEWIVLLQEDTRHSLMIEGTFIDKRELRAILGDRQYRNEESYKVLGYFDAALASYELAFQQYRSNEFSISKPIIRQIYAMMFRNDPYFSYEPVF